MAKVDPRGTITVPLPPPVWLLGDIMEGLAETALTRGGWRIVARHLRIFGGYRVVDIAAVRNGVRANFEVKFNTSSYHSWQRAWDAMWEKATGVKTYVIRGEWVNGTPMSGEIKIRNVRTRGGAIVTEQILRGGSRETRRIDGPLGGGSNPLEKWQ